MVTIHMCKACFCLIRRPKGIIRPQPHRQTAQHGGYGKGLIASGQLAMQRCFLVSFWKLTRFFLVLGVFVSHEHCTKRRNWTRYGFFLYKVLQRCWGDSINILAICGSTGSRLAWCPTSVMFPLSSMPWMSTVTLAEARELAFTGLVTS